MPNLANIAELTRLLEAAPQDPDTVHTRAELQAHFLASTSLGSLAIEPSPRNEAKALISRARFLRG